MRFGAQFVICYLFIVSIIYRKRNLTALTVHLPSNMAEPGGLTNDNHRWYQNTRDRVAVARHEVWTHLCSGVGLMDYVHVVQMKDNFALFAQEICDLQKLRFAPTLSR